MTDITQTIAYEDFVVGLANKTIRFEVKSKRLFAILFFDSFIVWTMRVLTFLIILPVFAIPYLCFKMNNWWLLFGFFGMLWGISIHGINKKASRPVKNMIELTLSFLFPLLIFIYLFGLVQPAVFSFACLIYSFFIFDLSNNLYEDLAQKNLTKNADFFYLAVDKEIIQITNR